MLASWPRTLRMCGSNRHAPLILADRLSGLRQLGDVDGYARRASSQILFLIPVPISPPKMDGIDPFIRWVATRLGGSCHGLTQSMPSAHGQTVVLDNSS